MWIPVSQHGHDQELDVPNAIQQLTHSASSKYPIEDGKLDGTILSSRPAGDYAVSGHFHVTIESVPGAKRTFLFLSDSFQ